MAKPRVKPTTLRGFLTALKAQRRRWFLSQGTIRFRSRKNESFEIPTCPLTAVYGGYYSDKVPFPFREPVIKAADAAFIHDPKIRRALLHATGLKEKVAA